MDQEDVCIVIVISAYFLVDMVEKQLNELCHNKMLIHQNFHTVFLELLVKNGTRFYFFSEADQTELHFYSLNTHLSHKFIY